MALSRGYQRVPLRIRVDSAFDLCEFPWNGSLHQPNRPICGGAVSGILPRQGSTQPNEAVKVTVGEIIALLITLIFYPATIIAGLTAAAKSKKALLTSGSLGLVWWVAAAYTVASLRLSSGLTLQFGMAFATSLIGVALMFVAYLVPNRQI